MSTEVDNVVNRIVQAIDIAINPNSDTKTRLEANTFIEEVKNGVNANFEQNFAVAFKLLNYTIPQASPDVFVKLSNINNFGLQLMELTVRFSWNKLNENCKSELKLMSENIICRREFSVNTLAHIYQNRLLKDQFSRLLVGILMREWPQKWPNFLSSCLNQPKNDLVLYTFWRLSEDIGIFFLPNNPQRRREINNELNENLDHILNYIADCLVLDNTDLTILALKTLCSFFEWSTLKPDALTFLCRVLTIEVNDTDTLFKILNNVADCFFTVLNRKSFKQDEKKVLLVFFEEQNLKILVSFLDKLLPFVQSKIENKVIDEKTFDLVKRICDIFSLMGQTCVSICSQANTPLPPTSSVYLHVMLKLIEYDNQIYNYYALQFWKDLFRNQHLKGSVPEEILIKIINIMPYKMVKKEEMNNIFLIHEFDGSADYDAFFIRFRMEFGEFLRSLTKHNEVLCFNLAISLIKQSLENKSQNKNEWSTIAIILDSVCNNLTNAEQFSEEALPVLKFMISMDNIDDPEFMSTLLSCLSALSVFMQYSKEDLFKDFLSKIFSLINYYTYSKETSFAARNRSIRDLRRHVCSLFIRLSIRYTKSLLSLFDMIKDYIFTLRSRPEVELTQLDQVSLFESLIILSNSFTDTHKQTEFILQILKPVDWLLDYKMSTVDFFKHIGLGSPQSEWENFLTNRTSLVYAVNIILTIIKRVNRKEVLLPSFLPYITSLTKLIKNLNEMWSPEIKQLCYPTYKDTIFAPLLENDHIGLLENFIPGFKQQTKKDDDETIYNFNRMQTFLWLLHENCYSAIGAATNLLGLEFYNNLQTIELIHSIGDLPDFKFKVILRTCMKPLISNCPKNELIYETKIFPLFSRFLPAFFEKINVKWDTIKQFRNNDLDQVANQDSDQLEKEILDEQICRLLSKEFIDILNILMIERLVSSTDEERLSMLGIYFLKQVPGLIYMTATMMTWLDSIISMKATTLTIKIVDKLAEDEIIKTSNTVSYIIKQILIALGYFGEHDQNQALLLNLFIKLYENYVLQNDYKDIKSQLVEYSAKNIRLWNTYEEKVVKNPNAKKKREAIKNLLGNVIGKNLSQLFKRQNKDEITNLEPLLSRAQRMKREQKLNDSFDDDDLSDTFYKFF